MKKAKSFLSVIYFSFPVQLLVVCIKKNILLLFYWFILFGIILLGFGKRFGIPYLFLDPEYHGFVGPLSLFIMGLATGGFIVAFNISGFILNGFRFPFLSALSRPFPKYFLNNFFIPLAFVVTYLACFIQFQWSQGAQNGTEIILEVMAFIFGGSITVVATMVLFFTQGKLMFRNRMQPEAKKPGKHKRNAKEWRVDSYIIHLHRARLTRNTAHYNPELVDLVARKNHLQAAIIEMLVFLTILVFGFFRDYDFMKIPAGASILIFFSLLVMLTSAFRFWLRGWAIAVGVGGILLVNTLSKSNLFSVTNHAYGLNYSVSPVPYSHRTTGFESDTSALFTDKNAMINILNRWKQKAVSIQGKEKPTAVLLCASGGGLRSALWTFHVLQETEKATGNALMGSTPFISGASGGTIGISFFRELYRLSQIDSLQPRGLPPIFHPSYKSVISQDMLNPLALALCVNDIFTGFEKFHDGKNLSRKDRGYEFEKHMNRNTLGLLDKNLGDFSQDEMTANIPVLLITPTIINDGRKLLVSSSPISFMAVQPLPGSEPELNEGVDFKRLFLNHDASEVKFTSVLRMNSTFPYITPTISLPSEPPVELMDAGMRDNFGVQNLMKFLFVFREWFKENTGKVVVVQVRDTHQDAGFRKKEKTSMVSGLLTPLESFYTNFSHIQDYTHNELFDYASTWFGGNLEFILLEMPYSEQTISLSWHLTQREKRTILDAWNSGNNQSQLRKLKENLGVRALKPEAISNDLP